MRVAHAIHILRQMGTMPDDEYRLAIAARDRGDLAGAEAILRRAWRAAPRNAGLANGLATVLLRQGRPERAVAVLRAGLRHGEAAPLHHNLGLALRQQRDFPAAAAAFRAALSLDPGLVTAHAGLGNTLRDLGELHAAEAQFATALRLDPQRPETQYDYALLQLATGRYAEGFARYEARLPVLGTRDFPQPRWRGEALAGRTLLVHAEQGFGDTIQFCRFLPRIAGRVVAVVPRALVRLLSGLAETVAHDAPLPPFDLHCPMMSLPACLGVTGDELGEVPYLAADAAPWRERLAGLPRPHVGVAWAGATHFAAAAAKAVAAARLSALLRRPGTFVSLQPDQKAPREMRDWTAELHDFADTAGLVRALDLVVSVDTAVAHLAGALGVPVWLLDRFDPCWRWLRDRDDSPWYPGLRIFRQERVGDWEGVLARVAVALERWPGE